MMKSKTVHRYRICGTPVRTGCITCKIRRVKCGEEKPFCTRCTSTGRKCDGYAPPGQPSSPRRLEARNSMSQNVIEDPMEERMLHLFSTTTAPHMSGDYSNYFWEQRVTASIREPSIRHGVIAVAAIHQDYLARHSPGMKQDPSLRPFAFSQYTKAISNLHNLMAAQTQQLDITLTSCILFICFDCISGKLDSAILHLKAGLKILEDIKKRNHLEGHSSKITTSQLWEQEFAPLLLGLGVQTALFIDPRYTDERAALWQMMREARLPTHPTKFRTLDEARHALDTCFADVMADRTSAYYIAAPMVPDPYAHGSRRHISRLQSWKSAFDEFLAHSANHETLTSKGQNGAKLLTVHWLLMSTILDTTSTDTRYEILLSLCNDLTCSRPDDEFGKPLTNFSTNLGIIAPLFTCALRAPEILFKKQAYGLLARSPRLEGMWDSNDAVMVAGEVIRCAEEDEQKRLLMGTGYSLPWDHKQKSEHIFWDDMSMRARERSSMPVFQAQYQSIAATPTHNSQEHIGSYSSTEYLPVEHVRLRS